MKSSALVHHAAQGEHVAFRAVISHLTRGSESICSCPFELPLAAEELSKTEIAQLEVPLPVFVLSDHVCGLYWRGQGVSEQGKNC